MEIESQIQIFLKTKLNIFPAKMQFTSINKLLKLTLSNMVCNSYFFSFNFEFFSCLLIVVCLYVMKMDSYIPISGWEN